MKKLVISVSAVALAICANAATFVWSNTSPIAQHDSVTPSAQYGVDLTSGTAYLIDGKSLAQSAFFTAAFAADDMSAYVASVAYKSGTLTTSSKFASVEGATINKGKASWTPSSTTYPDESSVSFYEAVVVTDGDKDYLYISEVKNATVSATGNTSFGFGNDGSLLTTKDAGAGFAGSAWYTAAPEPTSGLLLLLGMAGLALRRRRA